MIQKLDLPLLADCDIVVIGGGPSGVAAALAAARNGGKVLLVDQLNMLGGLGTAGVVPMFAPATDGVRKLYGGIFCEINTEMCRRMKVEENPTSWQPINAEILKRLLDEKIQEAGIDLLFGVKVCEAEVENGRITALLAATSCGLKRITGRIFIDATGDALAATLAGAEFDFGDANGVTMSPTLCAHFAGIDFDKVYNSGTSDRVIWRKMTEQGTAPLVEHHYVCMKQIGKTTATSNLGHIYGISGIDERELTFGYIEGRKIVHIFEEFYRNHVPGYEKLELITSAALLGVRETRRIRGEYCLTQADYQARAVFPDEIGRCCYPVDIHASAIDPEAQKQVEKVLAQSRYKQGESYGIPYRAMIPKKLRNVLVPGRALCADRAIQSSLRVMPPCFVTGQAAGIAAVLMKEDMRDVYTDELRNRLREMGAYFC